MERPLVVVEVGLGMRFGVVGWIASGARLRVGEPAAPRVGWMVQGGGAAGDW